MDGQIRLRQPQEMRALPPRPARTTLTVTGHDVSDAAPSRIVIKNIDGVLRRVRVPGSQQPTVATLRKAILDCAHQANLAEPHDSDRRLHSFIAKLSGTMEGLGERELDAVLWNLMASNPAPTTVPVERLNKPDEQLAMEWWNTLTEERRAHWLSKAVSAVPFAAWLAFCRSENDLAQDGSLQVVTPDRLIVDEVDRCGTGNPLDQVIAEKPGFVRRELDHHPASPGMAKPEANAAIGQCGKGDVWITLDDDR